jgi:hypothetical protein
MGQWSTNPAANLTLADMANDQVQPKIRATPDGGCYVSWFDNRTGGYDVYLQRLNAAGVEQWQHNGILIRDRGVSSTVDYELAVDSVGNAIIAYNDDTFNPGTQQVMVQKVDPSGNLLWGAGTRVSDGVASWIAPPKVCVLPGDAVGVAYTGTNTVLVQKLDSAGVAQWASPVAVSETSHYMSTCDIKPGDSGGAIVLWVRGSTTNPTTSSKALYSQKFDSAGVPVWTGTGVSIGGGSPVIVFNTTSIQNGYFPTFLSDGAGGAVYGWYEIGGSRNAYIQHVLSNGTLKFVAPVANTGATPGLARYGAGLAYNTSTGEYFLASESGTTVSSTATAAMVQKFDSSGNRLWGDTGVEVLPGPNSPSFVQCMASGDGCMVFCLNNGGTSNGTVLGSRVNGDSTVAWSLLPGSSPNNKSRLNTARSTQGFAMLAWGNGPFGSVDIQVQNVTAAGTFGPAGTCYANCDQSTIAPILNVNDFSCFLNRYAAGDSYANCDGSTIAPVLNVNDFSCFLNSYAAGCP